jgi:D-glycero-D-manno-heptose 1,7-bisphosphate phosphatase
MRENLERVDTFKEAGPWAKAASLFLDRDGVIIRDAHYISNPKDVEVIPGIRELIIRAREIGMMVIIVTNQSGIGRGLFGWDEYESVNKEMLRQLGNDSKPDVIYANGYQPSDETGWWRKPSPGMLLDAQQRYMIEMRDSILVGDRLADVQAGVAGKIGKIYHVKTGHGAEERDAVKSYLNESIRRGESDVNCRIELVDGANDVRIDAQTTVDQKAKNGDKRH